jgi:hypothetical protein
MVWDILTSLLLFLTSIISVPALTAGWQKKAPAVETCSRRKALRPG